jgi:hypothetical protein
VDEIHLGKKTKFLTVASMHPMSNYCGEPIFVSYRGIADVSSKVIQRISKGEAVDPSEYYFRITPVFETGSQKYSWLNRLITVGVGRITPGGVSYSVFAIK